MTLMLMGLQPHMHRRPNGLLLRSSQVPASQGALAAAVLPVWSRLCHRKKLLLRPPGESLSAHAVALLYCALHVHGRMCVSIKRQDVWWIALVRAVSAVVTMCLRHAYICLRSGSASVRLLIRNKCRLTNLVKDHQAECRICVLHASFCSTIQISRARAHDS